MSGIHRFIVRFKNTHAFNLITVGFSQTTNWFSNLKVRLIKFTITAIALLLKFITTLKIKIIKFAITVTGLLQRLPLTIAIKKIKFTNLMKLLERWTQTIAVKKLKFTILIRELKRLGLTTLTIKKIRLTAITIVASFRLLNYYDSLTTSPLHGGMGFYLDDMDGSYLSDLDYTVSP